MSGPLLACICHTNTPTNNGEDDGRVEACRGCLSRGHQRWWWWVKRRRVPHPYGWTFGGGLSWHSSLCFLSRGPCKMQTIEVSGALIKLGMEFYESCWLVSLIEQVKLGVSKGVHYFSQ